MGITKARKEELMRPLAIGDIVKSKLTVLANDAGALGVVYHFYKMKIDDEEPADGVGVIFENGEFDWFPVTDQLRYLERVGHEPSLESYKFKDNETLSDDYDKGYFDVVFE